MGGTSKNLKVCFLINDWVRLLNRDHTAFFIEFIDALKELYNVEVTDDHPDAHKGVDYELTVDKGTFLRVHDSEIVIEDLDNNNFYILSAHDQISQCTLQEKSNPKLKKVLYSQFIPVEIIHHTEGSYFKYSPWIYFKYSPIDLEPFRQLRKESSTNIPKLFFKGKTDDRPILNYINKEIISDYKPSDSNSYFNDMISHEVGLALGGVSNGDLCYRDVEYLQLGIPFIKFEYISQLYSPLIPNYHYISIPVPDDLPIHNSVKKDRLGLEHHAKLVEDKFRNIINDKNLLKTIGENGRKYFEANLSPKVRVKKTLELLNYFNNE